MLNLSVLILTSSLCLHIFVDKSFGIADILVSFGIGVYLNIAYKNVHKKLTEYNSLS